MGTCDVYSIQECKRILPGCSGSMSNTVESAADALSFVGVVFFWLGNGTTIFDGDLFVK